LLGIVNDVGNSSPSDAIYEGNAHHMSNFGILAKFMMEKSTEYNGFVRLHSHVFRLAREMTEHKAKYEESVNQAIFDLVKSLVKAQQAQMPCKPSPTSKPNVIKQNMKVKTVRAKVEFELKIVSKKMMQDFIKFCSKAVKNKVLVEAGLGDHAEPLPQLDILQ
jgi:hypothetical protein